MVIDAHGIRVDLPAGWEGRIYRRPHGDPTLHAGTFALPAHDGDFGTHATHVMPPGASFLVLTEYRPGEGLEPGRGLFASRTLPLPLEPRHFRADTLLVGLPSRAGLQHFCTLGERPFCLYAVVRARGRVAAAASQVGEIDSVLQTLRIARR